MEEGSIELFPLKGNGGSECDFGERLPAPLKVEAIYGKHTYPRHALVN